MKTILRKIDAYECKKFSSTLKQHKDYTRVLLEITRKLLNNGDWIEKTSLSTQAYMKMVIDRQSRVFVYLGTDKFYSFVYPCQIEVDKLTNNVDSIYTTSKIKCTQELISNAISILDEVKCDSIIDVYESRNDEDAFLNIEAYKLLEYFWANEPCYLRYDFDPKSSNGALHPLHHLDINLSNKGTYKIGLNARLTPDKFENIVNNNTDCYYLLEKLPSHLLMLKGEKIMKKQRKNKKKKK